MAYIPQVIMVHLPIPGSGPPRRPQSRRELGRATARARSRALCCLGVDFAVRWRLELLFFRITSLTSAARCPSIRERPAGLINRYTMEIEPDDSSSNSNAAFAAPIRGARVAFAILRMAAGLETGPRRSLSVRGRPLPVLPVRLPVMLTREAYWKTFENPRFYRPIERQERPLSTSLPVFLPVTRERQPSGDRFVATASATTHSRRTDVIS